MQLNPFADGCSRRRNARGLLYLAAVPISGHDQEHRQGQSNGRLGSGQGVVTGSHALLRAATRLTHAPRWRRADAGTW